MAGSLDRRSDRPLYLQIADDLRSDIVEGRLRPGEQAPSEHSTMKRYGASRDTVRKAIAVLRTEGRLDTERGRGVFVRGGRPVQMMTSERLRRRNRRNGRPSTLDDAAAAGGADVDLEHGKASADVAARLGLRKGDQVLILRRRIGAEGRPSHLATSYLSLRLVKGSRIESAAGGPEETYAHLEDLGYRLGRFEERVTARMPLPEEARALRMGPGTPVICVARTAYSKIDDRPVEICDTVMAADCFELRYDISAK